ncbi:hypothetical protein DMN91_006747 [Ooceraea biroi]|uniref:Structural maintenance of chromosomes protein 5 n=1 Tax=Ooceraea biroi TaxID=2015173 RepID=A0A3L8DIG5_OOCBI|nr:hypothetical protein DMN91_006747 [Ooceraea biroi]
MMYVYNRTYDKVIVKPTRYLNVIIGPNGSGKSTIVAAIVLGLGGKPSIIGRAIHIGEYVKYGCEEAKIEIHLKNHTKQDVVTRIFSKHGKSIWTINNKPVHIKDVQEFTTSHNIQVDNLCQFLPQDKVQDFSKMNAQALLENTERSVGDPKLLEYHQSLKEHRARFKQFEVDIANKKRLLDSNTQKHDGLQQTVSTIKERKLIKKKILTLKQKKAWILYDQMRRKLVESKKVRDAAAKKMQSIDATLKPMKTNIEKIRSNMKTLRDSLNNHNNKVYAKNTKVKNMMNNILTCENRIKESENTCSRRIQVEQNRDQDINLAQQQKCKLENDLFLMIDDIGSEESLMKQIQNIANNMEKHRSTINKLANKNITIKHEEENISRELRALQAEHKSLNFETKRLELLRQRSSDAYKGVLWLRENRNKFSMTVHEPMLLNINVKEASYAKYLESIISVRDLIAFTCENKQDMNLLLKYLRDQQKLQVNVVHSDPMKRVFMQPEIPIENITKFGFKHYLVSLIEAPSTIMKYLVPMYHLHNIPVGTNEVEDKTDHVPRSLRCYFSENNIYTVSMSKYTRATSTRISRVSGNAMLSIVLDKSRLQRIQERLQSLQEKRNCVLLHIKETEDKICEETKELDKYRADRNKYQQNIQQIQALKGRLRIVAGKIKQMETDRTSIDDIKAACIKEIKVIINEQLKMYENYNVILKECFDCIIRNEEIKFALTLLQQSLVSKENEIEELKDKFTEAERIFKQFDEDFQPLKKEAHRLYKEALKTTENINPQDDAFKPYNKAFEKLPTTIAEINNELNIAQAKVFCLAKNIDAENVMREYEQVRSNIQNLTEVIKTRTAEVENITKEIEKLKEKWLQPLEQLVEKINANFSSYFSAMDCAGEVTLAHGENALDFDEYGLKIRVKFRDADELQELTRHFQSGGERTVTTAIYMIALQELSRVPFRCVDEINQGMDAMNEKRIFNLLVKMTGRPGSSQYFLLTPKLLSELTYTETVTVHCVYNGPLDASDEDFDFDTEAYCNRISNK